MCQEAQHALDDAYVCIAAQLELSRNKCRDKRIDVWPRAVDTTVFNPAFRSQSMRERMTDGNPDATILVYVGRLGAGLAPYHHSNIMSLTLLHGFVTSNAVRKRDTVKFITASTFWPARHQSVRSNASQQCCC